MTAPSNGVDEMLAALEPFAKIADDLDRAHEQRVRHYADEGHKAGPPNKDSEYASVRVGDCRKAREAIRASARPAVDGGEREEISSIIAEWFPGKQALRDRCADAILTRLAAKPADPDARNDKRMLEDMTLAHNVRKATIKECAKLVEEMNFPAPRKNHRYQHDVKYKIVADILALSTTAERNPSGDNSLTDPSDMGFPE